ncbi:HNH endonuclease signature motif containing protein [Kocuria nitroreducens]|uniref:HNH endonuclease signature motif containing protein n=1 Tax=Kocuria nitroreducens TaxID=3058914 RepID=UPI0036DA8D2D
MAATAVPPRSLEDALREETDLAEIGEEFSDGVRALVEESRAEARAAGRQYRLLHRLWQLQEEAREQRWMVEALWMPPEADRLGPHSLEPDEQTVRDVADEIGPVLRLPAGTALRRVEDAVMLAEALPEVLEALEQGLVGVRQAGVLVELWRELVRDADSLPPEQQAPVESVRRIVDELLFRAPDSTVAQLRAFARRRRAGLLRETEEQRHRLALRDRRVWVEPREDGMAQLCALLDAATAHAIQDRLDTLVGRAVPAAPVEVLTAQTPASSLPASSATAASDGGSLELAPGSPERRTVPQLRADVLADLLLDGEPADLPDHLRGIRGHVTVTVPVLALLRDAGEGIPGSVESLPRTSRCAELEGYGPIPVGLAERIAARAPSWSRILTHPVTGTVLDRDRSTYAVPADLKHRLRARDGTCRFPGCRRRASRCDLDHTIAWADGGRTSADNLAHLCRHHHLLKHRDGPLGRWRVEHVAPERLEPGHLEHGGFKPGRSDPRQPQPGREYPVPEESGEANFLHHHGVLEWTSPAGQVHRTYPQEHHHPDPAPDRKSYVVPAPAPRPGPDHAPHRVTGAAPCSVPRSGPGVDPAGDPPPF